jgi:hypothetical protein
MHAAGPVTGQQKTDHGTKWQMKTVGDHDELVSGSGDPGNWRTLRRFAVPLCPITHELSTILYCTNKPANLPFMSHAQSTASSSSKGPNFQLIINNALDKYKKRTKNDLLAHPLAAQLQSCDSPAAILAILHQQVQGSDQSQSSDERWSRWLDPTINVLYVLSSTLGAGVSLVCLRAELVWDLHAHTYLAGLLASDGDIFRDRRSPFSAYPS